MSAPVVDPTADTKPLVEQWLSPVVVALAGDHDFSTVEELSREFARVIGDDGSNVVVDLSGVTFMDVSIINLLFRARLYLGSESRELLLRAPSVSARRLLDLCESMRPLGFHIVRDGNQTKPNPPQHD